MFPDAGGPTPPVVLVIAGSDSGGGAGIQADIKSCMAQGVHATTVVTAVTAQNSRGVQGVWPLPVAAVIEQFRSVMDDIGAGAIKIGMLGTAELGRAVAELVAPYADDIPVVLDPVCASKHGDPLIDDSALDILRRELLPLAAVVTPNLPEAALLLGTAVDTEQEQREAASQLVELGAGWALVKGGHLAGDATDVLTDGATVLTFPQSRIRMHHTHGTGCTMASAIAAHIALGAMVPAAVTLAKRYVTGAIEHAYPLGSGIGPLRHWWQASSPE